MTRLRRFAAGCRVGGSDIRLRLKRQPRSTPAIERINGEPPLLSDLTCSEIELALPSVAPLRPLSCLLV